MLQRLFNFTLSFLFFTLLSSSTFATVSHEGKESREISYSAQNLGLKTSEGIKDFADLGKRILGNEFGTVGVLSKVWSVT